MGWNRKTPTLVPPTESKTADRELITIGVPIASGVDGVGLGVFRFLHLLQALNYRDDHPFRYEYQMVVDKRPVEWARNLIVGQFLKNPDASRLWFIDNDMAPKENMLSMLGSTADITAAFALAFDHGNEAKKTPDRLKPCLFRHNAELESFNPILPQVGDEEVEIDAAGTATMLIRRRVLEDRRLWGPTTYRNLKGELCDLDSERDEEDWGPPIFRFQRKPNANGLRSEDIDFSWRAKQLGYRVTGRPGIRVGHYKAINLDSVLSLVNDTAARYGDAVLQEYKNADEGKMDRSGPVSVAR